MKRVDALRAIRAAGATNDRRAFMRLYVENRISLSAANAAWSEGVRLAAFVASRDREGAAQ